MEKIISYLLSPELIPPPYSTILDAIKPLFLIISLLFLSLITFVLLKSKRLTYRFIEDLSEFAKFKPHEVNKLVKNWKKITKKLESGLESECKLAVIEADIMLEEILKRMGHTEETVEEKLKNTTSVELKNIEDVKIARKIRNSVVYDPDYHLTLDKTKETLKIYEDAFKSLNVFS